MAFVYINAQGILHLTTDLTKSDWRSPSIGWKLDSHDFLITEVIWIFGN